MGIVKNDIIPLEITNCDLNGNGIGRYNDLAVFVNGAAAGDRLNAHILKVKSNCAFARIDSITVPSADRIDALCPVNLKCGGCSFGHINYEAEARIKENHVRECFRRIGGIEPEFEPIITDGKIYRYRNKAQFPVEISGSEIKTGFYASRTHRVIHCPGCILQAEEFEGILGVFEEYIKQTAITSYDEESHRGLLRHIYLRKGTATGEIMVCPVINGDSLPREELLAEMLTEKYDSVKSVVININKEKTNVILGKRCRTVYGKGYITDKLCGLEFRISPLSFYQVNRDQAEKLYMKAAEYANLTGSENLLDLYCGTGTIGLTMARKAKHLTGIEIVPQAVSDAKINAEINGIHNAEFICSDAAEAAKRLSDEKRLPDVIIFDPPRKGCSAEMIKTAAEMRPDRMVYISCDPATLARDCKIFDSLGYKTVKATPVDMFPRTGHVETVCCLYHQKKDFISVPYEPKDDGYMNQLK